MIHIVKGFSIVNEAEVDVFLEFPCFIYGTVSSVQFSFSVVSNSLWSHGLQHARPPCPSPTHGTMDVSNLISVSSAFSKSSLYIWKFLVHILLKSSLKDFEHYPANMWHEHNCIVVPLVLPFLEIGMKTDLFQFFGHCWDFQICWHIECSTLTAHGLSQLILKILNFF